MATKSYIYMSYHIIKPGTFLYAVIPTENQDKHEEQNATQGFTDFITPRFCKG